MASHIHSCHFETWTQKRESVNVKKNMRNHCGMRKKQYLCTPIIIKEGFMSPSACENSPLFGQTDGSAGTLEILSNKH